MLELPILAVLMFPKIVLVVLRDLFTDVFVLTEQILDASGSIFYESEVHLRCFTAYMHKPTNVSDPNEVGGGQRLAKIRTADTKFCPWVHNYIVFGAITINVQCVPCCCYRLQHTSCLCSGVRDGKQKIHRSDRI